MMAGVEIEPAPSSITGFEKFFLFARGKS